VPKSKKKTLKPALSSCISVSSCDPIYC